MSSNAGGGIDVVTGSAVNTIEKLFGKTGQTKRVANVWITIPEVVAILGKRTHQVRPLIWDGELGESRKEGRRVVVRKSAVLAYQRVHPGTGQTATTPSDLAQGVMSACELVGKLFAANITATGGKEFVAKVQHSLDRFVADARSLVS